MPMYCAFIGLNYTGKPYALGSCDRDAEDYAAMYRPLTESIQVFKTMTINRFKSMIAELSNLAVDGDKLVFSFSGHGTQKKCSDASEADGLTECLLFDDGAMTDDMLAGVMKPLYVKDVSILWYIDACHSGTVLDFCYQIFDNDTAIITTKDRHVSVDKASVLSISACADNQTDADGRYNGALTTYIKQFYGSSPDRTLDDMIAAIKIPGQRMTYSMSHKLNMLSLPYECELARAAITVTHRGVNATRRPRKAGCVIA